MFREFNEFFYKLFFIKNDNRNLLLDYNCAALPLSKTYPTTGTNEVVFSFNTSKLGFINVNLIEL